MENRKNEKVRRIVGLGLFTAIVIVLQFVGSSIRFGMFSISLVLVPIVVGAALYGRLAGVWLGFAFGMTVLGYRRRDSELPPGFDRIYASFVGHTIDFDETVDAMVALVREAAPSA